MAGQLKLKDFLNPSKAKRKGDDDNDGGDEKKKRECWNGNRIQS